MSEQLCIDLDAHDARERRLLECRERLWDELHRKDVLAVFDELARDDGRPKASYDLVRAVKAKLGADVSESNVTARVRQIRDVLGGTVVPRARRHTKKGPFRYMVLL